MTTIRDVAARAAVSLGTASRALTGNPATSAKSPERVAAAAAELGYLRNARAGSLRRAKTEVVGILISDVRNLFFAELAHAAEQEALRRGYVVILANADEQAGQEQLYLRAFLSQRGLRTPSSPPCKRPSAAVEGSRDPMRVASRERTTG